MSGGAHSHEAKATAMNGADNHEVEVEAEAMSHVLEAKAEGAWDAAAPLRPAVRFSLETQAHLRFLEEAKNTSEDEGGGKGSFVGKAEKSFQK
ncbi:hypothetical protein NL676_019865 [Syzygium grande]|nr:hypothetical protein NL676_019865 [Syzygium grande]